MEVMHQHRISEYRNERFTEYELESRILVTGLCRVGLGAAKYRTRQVPNSLVTLVQMIACRNPEPVCYIFSLL